MSQILVAEDEAMLRAIAVEMLEDAGFSVFQAGDGEEALTLLRGNPGIEVLVSDIKMPRMDGYALAEAGLALRPELKILLMTGYAQEPPPALLRAGKSGPCTSRLIWSGFAIWLVKGPAILEGRVFARPRLRPFLALKNLVIKELFLLRTM